MLQVVIYQVDESTTVRFEVGATEGFGPAGREQILGRIKEAAADRVEMKFGVKASGTANRLVAKAAGDGNFTALAWSHDARPVLEDKQ
jgi:Trypsin-co-occurring domain 1